MNIIIEIAVFILVFWLLVSIFRMLASKLEQFIDLFEKIDTSRETAQVVPFSKTLVKTTEDAAEVYAQRKR